MCWGCWRVRGGPGSRRAGQGVTRFAEAGPGGALTALAAQHPGPAGAPPAGDPAGGPAGDLAGGPGGDLGGVVVAVPVLRGDRGEEAALAAALARLHVAGVPVDWAAWVAGAGARRVGPPTDPLPH